MTEKEIDHTATPEIVCPHCGYEYSDSWEYLRLMRDDWGYSCLVRKCVSCGKEFEFEREIIVTYTTWKL